MFLNKRVGSTKLSFHCKVKEWGRVVGNWWLVWNWGIISAEWLGKGTTVPLGLQPSSLNCKQHWLWKISIWSHFCDEEVYRVNFAFPCDSYTTVGVPHVPSVFSLCASHIRNRTDLKSSLVVKKKTTSTHLFFSDFFLSDTSLTWWAQIRPKVLGSCGSMPSPPIISDLQLCSMWLSVSCKQAWGCNLHWLFILMKTYDRQLSL